MTINANRYDAIDDYILNEIEQEYLHADRSEKLDILKKIYLSTNDIRHSIPYKLAKLFIQEADGYILIWLAKHGANFDYRERDYSVEGKNAVYKYPDRNLWEIFETNENEYVKASLHENSDYESGMFISTFLDDKLKKLTQLERLALVRNKFDSPYTLLSIANQLFESGSTLQFLSPDEKNELRRAILTNQYFIDYTHDIVSDTLAFMEAERELNQLWQSIYACDDYLSKKIAFRNIGGFDEAKKSIYKKLLDSLCETEDEERSFKNFGNDQLRYNIISNCSTKDSETLLLGMNDPTFYISNLAESKYLPKIKSDFNYYLKTYLPSVLQEIFNIVVVVILVSQFEARIQLLLICAVIYSYVILNYKSTNTLISNTRQSLVLLSNIKLIKSSQKEIENKDKDIMFAVNTLKVATTKLYITGISTFIISIYLTYRFITAII